MKCYNRSLYSVTVKQDRRDFKVSAISKGDYAFKFSRSHSFCKTTKCGTGHIKIGTNLNITEHELHIGSPKH